MACDFRWLQLACLPLRHWLTILVTYVWHGLGKDDSVVRSDLPRLLYLGLRCADRPIDLVPPFQPGHYVYQAFLDFAAGNFAVDAAGEPGMAVVNQEALQTTHMMPPGETSHVEIRVQSLKTKIQMQYSVAVHRLSGRDIKIRSLELPGTAITPMFDPSITDYYVKLPTEQEFLNVRFVPWDTGQTFKVLSAAANFEIAPTNAPAAAPQLVGDGIEGDLKPTSVVQEDPGSQRRLGGVGTVPAPPSGETQYTVIERRFPIEVGSARLVTVTVHPADGDQTKSRVYSLKTTRSGCPQHLPYFAPDVLACSLTCNEGYFPHSEAHRCESCSSHCIRCFAWDGCQECEPSQWRVLYFITLTGGHCQVVQIPWREIIIGLVALVVLLAVCSVLCCAGRYKVRRYHQRRPKKEEDGPQSHRLLPADGEDSFEEDELSDE